MNRSDIHDWLWVTPDPKQSIPPMRALHAALTRRGVETLICAGSAYAEELWRKVAATGKHVMLDFPGVLPGWFYRRLAARGNFSMGFCDWWSAPLVPNADYLIFRHYHAIEAIQRGGCVVLEGPVPIVSPVETATKWALLNTTLRLACLPLLPFRGALMWRQRRRWRPSKRSLLYLPFCVDLPETIEPPPIKLHDFANLGTTYLYAWIRNPFFPTHASFINLYEDRRRLVTTLLRHEGNPFRVFDHRRTPVYGMETLRAATTARYAVATGGLHRASIAKFLEFAAVGVPMIGRRPGREFPLLRDCVFEVAPYAGEEAIKSAYEKALEAYSAYQMAADAVRGPVRALYAPERLLDLLQAQVAGQPVPPEYLAT